MNKLELSSALKAEANISKAEAAKVVQIFFDNMADAMARGCLLYTSDAADDEYNV